MHACRHPERDREREERERERDEWKVGVLSDGSVAVGLLQQRCNRVVWFACITQYEEFSLLARYETSLFNLLELLDTKMHRNFSV